MQSERVILPSNCAGKVPNETSRGEARSRPPQKEQDLVRTLGVDMSEKVARQKGEVRATIMAGRQRNTSRPNMRMTRRLIARTLTTLLTRTWFVD